MNILAIGAHFDDVELGCGATLKKLKDEGHNIYIYVGTTSGFLNVSTSDPIRTDDDAASEGRVTAGMIGAELICGDFTTFNLDYGRKLDTTMTRLIETYGIDLLFMNWCDDPHHDHWSLARAALHGARHVNRILAYHSSWYGAERQFMPNFFVDISDYWEFKRALLKSFASEYSRVGDKWMTFCENEALLNGLKNDCKYAEGFECIRWLL